jgi:hypothetical protein
MFNFYYFYELVDLSRHFDPFPHAEVADQIDQGQAHHDFPVDRPQAFDALADVGHHFFGRVKPQEAFAVNWVKVQKIFKTKQNSN